jgi:hypothetical protein
MVCYPETHTEKASFLLLFIFRFLQQQRKIFQHEVNSVFTRCHGVVDVSLGGCFCLVIGICGR